MKIARTARLTLCLLALTTSLPVVGCDWLDPSGSGERVSPVIGDLEAPQTAYCCKPDPNHEDKCDPYELVISFEYSDPQDDIYQFIMTLEHEGTKEKIEESVPWTLAGDDPPLDLLTVPGRAIYRDFFFPCGLYPGGDWKLTVRVEDEKGHKSNELTKEYIDLVKAED